MIFNVFVVALFVATLASVPTRSDALRKLPESSHVDFKNVPEQKTPSFIQKVFKLDEEWQVFKRDLDELCKSGRIYSPLCHFKLSKDLAETSDKTSSPRGSAEPRDLPRAIRCRPGLAHCPNGKREIAQSTERRSFCPTGWAFCF